MVNPDYLRNILVKDGRWLAYLSQVRDRQQLVQAKQELPEQLFQFLVKLGAILLRELLLYTKRRDTHTHTHTHTHTFYLF